LDGARSIRRKIAECPQAVAYLRIDDVPILWSVRLVFG